MEKQDRNKPESEDEISKILQDVPDTVLQHQSDEASDVDEQSHLHSDTRCGNCCGTPRTGSYCVRVGSSCRRRLHYHVLVGLCLCQASELSNRCQLHLLNLARWSDNLGHLLRR